MGGTWTRAITNTRIQFQNQTLLFQFNTLLYISFFMCMCMGVKWVRCIQMSQSWLLMDTFILQKRAIWKSYKNKWEVEEPLIVAKLSKLQSRLYHLMCSEHQQAALVAMQLRMKHGSSAGTLAD